MMQALEVGVAGTGYYVPACSLTNQELIDRYGLDTTDAWIVEKTGIRERRVAGPDETTSTLGARAGLRALEAAGVAPEELDAVLVATSSPDMMQPPTACLVQSELGARRALACDVGAVCSGFIYALVMGAGLLTTRPDLSSVLVVGAETYSRILDYTDRSTCIFFGDGAGAVVLQRTASPGLLSYTLGADGSRAPVIGVPAGGVASPAYAAAVAYGHQYFRMEGRQVWDFVSETLPHIVDELVTRAALHVEDVDLFIPHQANAVLLRHALALADVPAERVFLNVDRYANTAGASVPIALAEAAQQGLLQPGQRVALAAFGGGLTWGGVLLQWTAEANQGMA